MKILVQSTGLDIVPGIIAELRKHQPDWQYFAWPSDEPCDYVVGWKPPAELFARQPKLKAVINYGAGVDAILAMVRCPRICRSCASKTPAWRNRWPNTRSTA